MPDSLVIALTGGGTAGHVSPHLALMPSLIGRGHRVFYIGSVGIERDMMKNAGVEFHQIMSGKLRRYFSVQNFFDLFKVICGTFQAFGVLRRQKPNVVFSKGGFVSVPVALAAWVMRIPVVTHESDMTPGLATKIIERFAKRILYTFPETGRHFRPAIAEHVGTPVRSELFSGSRESGFRLCGFAEKELLPVILVAGGSQGAQRINETLKIVLPELLERYRIVHLTGKGKGIGFAHPRYKAFEFVTGELADILAITDVVIARAGANSIFEFLSLKKPMLLIPLEVGSRGDQVHNAEAFQRQGWARILRESEVSSVRFLAAVEELLAGKDDILQRQANFNGRQATERVVMALESCASHGR